MSIRRLVLLIIFLSIFAMALRPALDNDSWWHLRTGQWILEEGQIPKEDPFSYTRAGETWRYPSAAWLSEAALYTLYDSWGPGAVNLLVAALVTLAFAFIYFTLSGGIFLRAFVLILAALASSVYWAARPYLASFLLAAVFLWILEDHRWGRANRLLWLPLLMAAWVNLHPGFAIGFILVGLYGLAEGIGWLHSAWTGSGLSLDREALRIGWRERLWPMAQALLPMLLAACLNPSGPALLRYPFETLSIGALADLIQEWQSPNFHLPQTLPFAALLFLTLAAVGAARRRLALSDFLLVAGLGMMALSAGRNIALFALAAPLGLTRYAEPAFEELRQRLGWQPFASGETPPRLRRVNLLLAALILGAAGLRLVQAFDAERNQASLRGYAPSGAVDYLREQGPPGRLLNSYNWGGYLIWALPDYPVYIDGRTDLYGDELIGEFVEIATAAEDWQQRLDERQIVLVLIEPTTALAKLLPYEGWQLLYEDSLSVLYARPEEQSD